MASQWEIFKIAYITLYSMSNIQCHVPVNNSEVIVTYAGHSDADRVLSHNIATNDKVEVAIEETTTTYIDTEPDKAPNSDIVFMPSARHVSDEDTDRDKVKTVHDILSGNQPKNVYEILQHPGEIRVETENPSNGGDIIFLTGKNEERGPEHETKQTRRTEGKRTEKETITLPRLDCVNLNCNNTVDSVCGGKIEHKKWRYRLFLNECFFRKVNCNFRYDMNRFLEVEIGKCNGVGAHYPEKPYYYKPINNNGKSIDILKDTRRTFASRRSINVQIDGSLCSHPCPVSCPEEYSPECAVSATGQKKVFVNHCKLDFNSCSYRAVWIRRPLAECIGKQQAELKENRAFVSWMHKVGIVDQKGRLVLE